jgi:hypothetical protein
MGNSPPTVSIHILDDDSLLHIFYLYQPFLLGEDEDDAARLVGGSREWVYGQWWYKPAHVCQRWRNIILGSTSYLGLCLVCTNGTPVADMLAHSPPLPLAIDYFDYITAEDEKGIILALKQRDRVHRVRLDRYIFMSVKQKLIAAMYEEYPILEYLIIMNRRWDNIPSLIFPKTLQAPHLRHLMLVGFTLPIESPLLMTAVGLATLGLHIDDPSIYLHPNALLQWLSLMPQLEVLWICFILPDPNCDVERQLQGQLTHSPTIILPNLRSFVFRGVSAHLEAIFHRIITPRLQKLKIYFYNQLTFSVPRFLQFLNTTENLRFGSAEFEFASGGVTVKLYPREEADSGTFTLDVQ